MKKILSLILPIAALTAGIAGGEMLRPATTADAATSSAEHGEAQPAEGDATETHAASEKGGGGGSAAAADGHGKEAPAGDAWFTFPSQFFVPMMRNGDMGAIMILTLSLETSSDKLEPMKVQEHRLRDALLRQLMIHANTGGFDRNFTSEASMRTLRERLLAAAQAATSLPVNAVLIEDIARQGT
ncbi:hypothetical protein [Paracoccus salsus]|uniref:hypothetical protein n=1 Tax=Paracoccus salsus TaxID=2911061 RepID=UPI001F27B3FD|nr:hypothetical protein [Paracoccus salsus]MCF3973421.1 hypothetical protein [Paracoccus salsus]